MTKKMILGRRNFIRSTGLAGTSILLPRQVMAALSKIKKLTQNIDFAPFFLEAAEAEVPKEIQGMSLIPLFKKPNAKWRKAIYYHYYEAGGHGVPLHYGIRDERYKLMHYPRTDEWNLVDLKKDPQEMQSVHDKPAYKKTLADMREKLSGLQNKYGVEKN